MAEEIVGIEAPEADEAQKAAEAQARLLGWRPKDEFVGDAERWRDAPEFLKHGQDTLPILRENNKRLLKEFQELKGSFKDFTGYHKKMLKKTEERSYEKAMKDILEEQRKAVEAGDLPTYDALEREKENIPAPVDDTPEGTPTAERDPVFVEWEGKNAWWNGDSPKDIRMTVRADEIARVCTSKGFSPDKMLATVDECMREEYPEYFTNSRTQNNATVSTPTRGTNENRGNKGKTYNDLPADAKEECNKYVKQGFEKEQYLKDYFGEE